MGGSHPAGRSDMRPDVSYRRASVPVTGGELRVGVWGKDGPLVVLVHGITSSHMAWVLVGPALASEQLVVGVDLRGRGGSRDLPPPYRMPAHAADVAAVIEAYGGGPVVLVGHSMGGFVAVATAIRHPELVRRLVLVDGGPPLPLPAGVEPGDEAQIGEAVAATVGTAYARLSMTFPDRQSYWDMWRAHPSLTEWTEATQAYVDYDLVGEPPLLRPACRLEAALADALDLYAVPGVTPTPLPVPAVFLRAERGMFNQETPLYPTGYATDWFPGIVERTVAGVNHYTILLGGSGGAAVARAIRDVG